MRWSEGKLEFSLPMSPAGLAMDSDVDAYDWVAQLMGSHKVAACVLEVSESGERIDYRFAAVSPGFAESTGLHDAVGRSMRELRPDHEQFWFDLYARVARTGEATHFEHGARALDRRFRGHAFRIGHPDAHQVVVIFENCSQLDGMENGAMPDSSDARIERFGATLAHELRAPLAPLGNGLRIVKQLSQSQEELRWTISMMERQFAQLTGLIDDLLDVGRLVSNNVHLERARVDLHHVISDSIEACGATIDARRHDVAIESVGNGLFVTGDIRRLNQVFTNLLTNSIKYTEPGGQIRIRLASVDGMAIVEVRDNGSGISREELPRVFDPFNQGRSHRYEPKGGLGIGLSIVKSIVRLHGGSVSAHSDGLGQGSCFTVRLPLSS